MKKAFVLFSMLSTVILLSAPQENPAKYWNFETLKNAPAYTDDAESQATHPGLRAIVYDGVKENGKITKNFAYIGIPSGKMPEGGYPGIVLVHGGGGTAFAWAAELWMSYGYAVIVPDWYGRRPGKEDRTRDAAGEGRTWVNGERSHSYDEVDCHVTNVANLILAHSLLRSLPQVNPEKTAYVGLSWGSWYGAMVAAVDPRFKGMVEIYLGDRKVDDTRFIDGRFLHAAKIPMYYVVGTNDYHGSPESMQAGFDSCGNMLGNHTMIVKLPHSHVGFRFEPVRRYVDAILQDKPGLPKLSRIQVDGQKISAAVIDPGKGVKKVYLCYTSDRERAHNERQWHTIPAKFDRKSNTVSANIPDNVFQCFLAVYDEYATGRMCCGTSEVLTFKLRPVRIDTWKKDL